VDVVITEPNDTIRIMLYVLESGGHCVF
jgi:hypothetical protein